MFRLHAKRWPGREPRDSVRRVTTYRELFGIREFRVLFGARLFAMIGVVVAGLALGTQLYDETRSPLITAVALFGGPLVQVVTARFLLASSDLLRPRTAMIAVACVTTTTSLLQLLPGLTWWSRLAILAAGYMVLAATSGTVIALLADIVPEQAFILARATLNLTVGGMQILGYGVGALLLAWLQPSSLFAVAAVASVIAGIVVRLGLADHPPRATGRVVERTRQVNRELLGSPVVLPLLLMMWVPNGLVVGCEALFIPYAGDAGGYLFAAGAAGMLAGDVVVGRFLPDAVRDRMILPMRVLLAVPFLAFPLDLPAGLLVALVFVSAFGYPAALPLQERLVRHTRQDIRGQVFGLSSTGLMAGQAVGAALAGGLAQVLDDAGQAMAVMAVLSLLTTAVLTPGLRRSAVIPGQVRA